MLERTQPTASAHITGHLLPPTQYFLAFCLSSSSQSAACTSLQAAYRDSRGFLSLETGVPDWLKSTRSCRP